MHPGSRRSLFIAFAALMLLLIATVAVAFVPLGSGNLWIALGIAVCKALLVVTIFMGLNRSTGVTRLAASAGVLWLTIAVTLVLADFMTRGVGETSASNLRTGVHFQAYDRVDTSE